MQSPLRKATQVHMSARSAHVEIKQADCHFEISVRSTLLEGLEHVPLGPSTAAFSRGVIHTCIVLISFPASQRLSSIFVSSIMLLQAVHIPPSYRVHVFFAENHVLSNRDLAWLLATVPHVRNLVHALQEPRRRNGLKPCVTAECVWESGFFQTRRTDESGRVLYPGILCDLYTRT